MGGIQPGFECKYLTAARIRSSIMKMFELKEKR